MSTLSAAQKNAPRKPARIVILPPSAFADTWSKRPIADVAVGLRRLCEDDLQIASGEASKYAIQLYRSNDGCVDEDARLEARNHALVSYAMARATTDPNDVTLPYFEMAEDVIKMALTPQGIGRLWDEYVVLSRSSGVDLPIASDADALRLSRLLKGGRLATLPQGVQAETRKLLMHILRNFGEDDAPEEEDDGVYHVVTS